MKIKSITVGNFKNLAETTLNLNKMVAVVSTNNYGKSNLLEAMQFGFDFISSSVKTRNGMMRWKKAIPLTKKLVDNEFIFSVEFDEPKLGEYRFVRYGFKFSWYNDQNDGAVITDETLEMRPNESVRYTAYLKRDKGQYRAGKSKTGFRKIVLAKDLLAIDVLSAIEDIEIADVIAAIKKMNYRICNTLELDPSFNPSPIAFDFNVNDSLAFDDEDIPKALSVLKKEYPEKFDLFLETIYDLFPEFQQIELQEYTLSESIKPRFKAIMVSTIDENSEPQNIPYHVRDELYRLVIRSEYLNQPLSLEHMSTGTKRIIWLIANAIFGGCYGANILGVDEIETSIHPRMTKSLLESLSELLGETALISTSHSPYLIQYLKADSIYVGVPNNEGMALFKRIQQSKLKALINTTRELQISIGEYLFELMSGDEDSAAILSAYLED